MVVELGHYALALALGLSMVQCVLPLWGARVGDGAMMAAARPAAVATFLCLLASFGALVHAYVVSDFSVANVVENSHSLKPLLFRITGVWGNHEGSMLLWVLVLALSGAVVALSRSLPERLRALTLGVLAMLTAAFLLFMLLTSNPFMRVEFPPFEGRDLNPLLQDIGLAIHPPLLYLGYVGFSISFAFAVAALLDGRVDAVWARAVRPWTLAAWVFLTLGIAMGSYWAYYELGWGGWWFWDPVENASLMPWLAGTALVHSAVVMEKRDALRVWTILLAILTFSLSLIGAFLVRSGVLTSVHAFATDPERGAFILVILVLFIGGALALFAWRAPMLRQGGIFAPVSREGALVLNNLLLCTACATVFIGTLYPLALEALTGDRISVGPPYFDATFLPLTMPLVAIMPLGQTLAWKRGDLLGAAQRLTAAFALSLAMVAMIVALTHGGPVLALAGVALGFFAVAGALSEIVTRSWRRGASLASVWRRARGLPSSAWGAAVAHAGIGLLVLGISATAWEVETLAIVRPGETINAGPYTLRLDSVSSLGRNTYKAEVVHFSVTRGETPIGRVTAEKRFYTTRGMATTEAGLMTRGLGQIYVAPGETLPDGGIAVRLYWKPFVLLIWIGAVVAAFGGGLSLIDRRLRIGVPRKSRADSRMLSDNRQILGGG
ncbi:heme lyase CcmF/NrfE family subunit [Pseudochelatococcus contaminans]|uniref:Cytochrome c-type biogenesis protein CcmF n=1 Tax=Pseudochelatococcus contaminans TaxID=1538103 RepID=A0A7W5Z505_9HYPH|nr:heme lyase CcmF/NrfE family subunit [Pseudochelatococcus contaminans]MBB3809829.1 cytochrome c-type biogenesis protein CcmF [Pseudochelatococcus contaminans]